MTAILSPGKRSNTPDQSMNHIGRAAHHTTSASWEVDEKTLVELYLIWFLTGALDMIKEVDESLHMILTEVMEERLEDAGIEL